MSGKTNIYNLFKFLEDKKGKEIPLKYKLIHAPELIPKDGLHIKDNVNLGHIKQEIHLPDSMKVDGYLYLSRSNIKSLPNNLKVGGYLFLWGDKIKSLPNNLKVGGRLYIKGTSIRSLPDDLQVEKYIVVDENKEKYFKENFPKFADKIVSL